METLYLASQSSSRKQLLEQACIPFKTIKSRFAEDTIARGSQSIYDYVTELACGKAQGVDRASISESSYIIVAADTLIETDQTQQMLGKPLDRSDAQRMLKLAQHEDISIVTGMALLVVKDGIEQDMVTWVSCSKALFSVPDEALDFYLDACPAALHACGACVVEGVGMRYMSYFEGNLAGAIGLDISGLYDALTR